MSLCNTSDISKSPTVDTGRLEIDQAVPAESRGVGRVLVVDDNESNLALMSTILRRAGYVNVELLQDSRRVVETVTRFEPDLVMLDLQMPGLDGFQVMELLEDVAIAGDFLPILVVTADATAETRERALGAGAKDLLIKPVDGVEVLQRTANLLETRMLYQELRARNLELEEQVRAQRERKAKAAASRKAKSAVVRRALDHQLYRSVFQPIVDIATGQAVGVEALTRFQSEPIRAPDVWFADATDAGLGAELELAAIASALREIDKIPAGTYMSLNCSPAVLVLPELAELIATVDTSRIVIEITEHHVIDDYTAIQSTLDGLRSRGVRIAVDDAGSGFASLRHILQLQPDVIKLDIALTREIDSDPVKRALASAMVVFSNEVGAKIVAEGVETADEFHTLRRLGVTTVQGYLLGRPQQVPVVINPVPTRVDRVPQGRDSTSTSNTAKTIDVTAIPPSPSNPDR